MANTEKKLGVFTDNLGLEWRPVLHALALIKACRQGGMTIERLTSMDVNMGDLIETIWFACETEAIDRGINRETFLTKHVTVTEISSAVQALWDAVRVAFPQLEDKVKKSGAKVPFVRGR